MNPRLSAKYNTNMPIDVIRSNCRVILLFGLWFALNVCYNITNKWALEDVRTKVIEAASQQNDFEVSYLSSSLPITIGCIQFGVGSAYACFLWILRIRPVPHADELSRGMTVVIRNCIGCMRMIRSAQFSESFRIAIVSQRERSSIGDLQATTLRDSSKIAVYHTFGQLCTIMSLSTNSISFAHVIKAMEPLFSAVASWLVLGQVMNFRVYISLLPVVVGVAMACAGAKEFSWISFWSGMGSNAFFAMRGVVSKIVMEKSVSDRTRAINGTDADQRERGHLQSSQMSPANLFAAVTCISFLLSIPLALLTEGSILMMLANHSAEIESQDVSRTLAYIISSGAFHYLNNEVMYVTLSKVHPITLAVGNTAKRVFIIIAGVLVFATPVTVQTAVGATIGIGGVFVYSLMKQWYNSGDKNNANDSTDEDVPTTEIAQKHKHII